MPDDAMSDDGYVPVDRRPIRTRDLKIAGRAARRLVAWGVSANTISVLGMIAGLLAGAALAGTSLGSPLTRVAWIVGAALCQIRLLANLLDGMVAIESGTASPVGELFNEVPDRVSDSAILVGLGFGVGGNPLLGLAAACGAMFTAYVRATGKVAGATQDFGGPMAKPQRMFLVTILALWCGLAPEAWNPVWASAPWGLPAILLGLVVIGTAVTALGRLARIAAALRKDSGDD